MDYVDGPNLLDIVKKFGPLDMGRAVSYIHQVAGGLDYAFRNSIIHRDIKPGNILVDRKGVARVLDMGLARFMNDHTDQLTIKYDDKIVLGTADYVAPEQVANSHSVDIRADIYALGATFYFLLAGHPPFPIGTVSQKLLWHRTKDATPIQQIRPEVPDGIAILVSKMMAKDPKARFQTPAQVAAELAPFLPETIQLPGTEEMPVLSPAAMVGGGAPADGVTEPAQGARSHSAAPAQVAAPALQATPANPFGMSAGSPWGSATATVAPPRSPAQAAQLPAPKPISRAVMKPLPPPELAVDTAAGEEHTPAVKRSNPFLGSNPFASEELETTTQPVPWKLIVGGIVGLIALAMVLFKFSH